MTEAPTARGTDVQYRVWSEFMEMPGLRLTLGQVCRLVGVDQRTGEAVLRELVDAAVLRQVGPYYVRADLGRFSA